jgi:hypothetical protein
LLIEKVALEMRLSFLPLAQRAAVAVAVLFPKQAVTVAQVAVAHTKGQQGQEIRQAHLPPRVTMVV